MPSDTSNNRARESLDSHETKSTRKQGHHSIQIQEISEKNSKNFVKGDEKCYACTGITYTTCKRQTEGKPAICIGYKSTKDTINKQHLPALDKITSVPNLTTFFAIGVCYWTGRVERLGQTPIMSRGLESITVETIEKKDSNSSNEGKKALAKETEISNLNVDKRGSYTSLNFDLLKNGVNRLTSVSNLLLKSCTNTLSAPDLSIRLHRSAMTLCSTSVSLGESIANTTYRVGRHILRQSTGSGSSTQI